MPKPNCLVLTQYRETSEYNDFIGKYYHFPGHDKKSYLSLFESLPIEFVYYEPEKGGKGEFFGYGRITTPPFKDKREQGNYFVEIAEYKPFSKPVYFKNEKNKIREQEYAAKFYNAQNSVRRTTKKFIEEICLDGGILLSFKSDVHLIKVLGEQLIASERVGILELIKNSYDAGSSYCKVRIEKVPALKPIDPLLYQFNDYEGPVIVIEDDGKGMSWEDIENGWLRPASTIKTNVKERLKEERQQADKKGTLKTFEKFVKVLKEENNGRIPLGEKGVGRFATHRLGKSLIIKTKTKELEYEYILEIDWDRFDEISEDTTDLDSVGVSLTRRPPSRDYGKRNSGTQIIIYGGREDYELTEAEIKEINRSINKLNSPFPEPKSDLEGFKATLDCPQLPSLDEPPVYKAFDPPFVILGIVDDNGILSYDFSFIPPSKTIPLPKDIRKNKRADLRQISEEKKFWADKDDPKKLRQPVCGQFYVHLEVWYRRGVWIEEVNPEFLDLWIEGPKKKEFTDYLDDYGGISVYRDKINIFPAEWGAETDWLRLSKRHIKRGLRLSYYNFIGNVELEQSTNVDLIDKTDREGLVKNQAFLDLSALVRGVILLIENDFVGKRNQYEKLVGKLDRVPQNLSNVSRVASNIFERMEDNYDIPNDPLGILEELGRKSERKTNLVNLRKSLKNLEKSLEVIKQNQDLMTEHAGFGLGMAVVIHEIAKTTANFYYGINAILKGNSWDEAKLRSLRDSASSLENEIKRISPLRAIKNETPISFKISRSINFCKEVFGQAFEKEGIDFSSNSKEDFDVKARYGAINQILSNLIDNSAYWLALTQNEKREIRIELDHTTRSMIFADTADGIHESIMPYLFEPGYSLRVPPSGLGLYICKYYMRELKGEIYLTSEKDRLTGYPGAQFTLDFSRVSEE